MTTVTPSPAFLKALKKLPPTRQDAAIVALERFIATPSLPGLKFRSFAGKAGHFIINSVHGDRIILRRDDPSTDAYTAADVGPHDNVYRRWNRSS